SAQQRAGGLAQQRAATTQTPRRPIGAGGVSGASRSGSASVITTHALLARKVQRKLSNGVAGFAAGGSSSERKRSRPIRAFSATPHDGQRPCRTLAEDPGRTGPELRIPGAAAQTRLVSMAGIRLRASSAGVARASIRAEILAYARAAYPQRRSSNANSLQSQNSAGFPQICAIFQSD